MKRRVTELVLYAHDAVSQSASTSKIAAHLRVENGVPLKQEVEAFEMAAASSPVKGSVSRMVKAVDTQTSRKSLLQKRHIS